MTRRFAALLAALLLVVSLTAGCKQSATTSAAGGAATTSNSAGSVAGGVPTSSSTAAACPASNGVAFAKTKFVLHAGLAFGAFHRYLYKPFRAGTFASGAHGRIKAFLKAGLAALFVKREVRLAYSDAAANPTLCKLVAAPLRKVGDLVSSAVTGLRGGSSSGLVGVEQAVQSAKANAQSTGTTITEDANAPLS